MTALLNIFQRASEKIAKIDPIKVTVKEHGSLNDVGEVIGVEVLSQTPWYLTYGFINLFQVTIIFIGSLLLLNWCLQQDWRNIAMETWDFAKTVILYIEHIAMVLVGAMGVYIMRNRKYNALVQENKRKENLLSRYRQEMYKYKKEEAIAEKEEMRAKRREEERERVQIETPKQLLDIAKLFGSTYIDAQFKDSIFDNKGRK